MKNSKQKIIHTTCILLLIFITQSCGNKNPIIGGEVPFVVYEIAKHNKTHSKYYSENNGSGNSTNSFHGRPMIVLPTKMYNVGDTIKPFEFNKK